MKTNFLTRIVFLVFLVILLVFVKQWRCVDGRGKHCIASDGRGYYAYLPAVFIYHDLHFDFIRQTEKKFEEEQNIGGFLVKSGNKSVDKYFSGVAFLMTPFFLAAMLCSKLFGLAPDGYSDIFQASVCAASIFYFLLGMFFLRRTLLLYHFSQNTAAISMLLIGLGTNLFYYTVMEPSMSHVYSFAMISMFIYGMKRFFVFDEIQALSLSLIALGIIVIIRPPNALVLASVPFLAGEFSILKKGFLFALHSYRKLLSPILLAILIVSLQPLLWYLQTGSFFLWSYPGEEFNFLKPEILNILFSYRKGLFVYTPMIFFSLFGCWFIFKQSKFAFLTFSFFFLLVTFVLSSWWSWWYGGSFGLRAFIDYYAFFAILISFLFHSVKKAGWRLVLISIASVLLYVNFIQAYQYSFNILKWDGMSKSRYWEVFLSTKNRYRGYLTKEYVPLDSSTVKKIYVFNNDFEKQETQKPESISKLYSFSGKQSTTACSANWFTLGYAERVSNITSEKNAYLRVSCMALLEHLDADAQLVISFEKGGSAYDWRGILLNEFINHKKIWNKISYENRFPALQSADDTLKIYVMTTKKNVFMDDLRIEVFDLK